MRVQLLICLAMALVTSPSVAEGELEQRIERAVSSAVASVGTLSAATDDGPRFGSGFVLDRERGWVLTNHHVVAGAHRVAFENSATVAPVPLEVAYFESSLDLALLVAKEPQRLPPALALARGGSPRQGQFVIAVGSPEGLGQTTTLGLVSAVERRLPGGKIESPFIQIDAAVYQGSSGGPLCNLSGEVVGVVTRRASTGHAAFALPGEAVAGFLERFASRGSAPGVVRHEGHLGVELQELSRPLSRHLAYAGPGVVVAGVYARSAADRAGLQPGDVLVSLDNVELDAASAGGVLLVESRILGAGPGSHELVVFRQGERLALTVELQSFPPCRSEVVSSERDGALFHRANHCYWFPAGEFVEVTKRFGLERGDQFPEGLLEGDLMVEAVGAHSLLEVLQPLSRREEPTPSLLVRVLRNGRPRLVLIDER